MACFKALFSACGCCAPQKRNATAILIGVENAGKTTIFGDLKGVKTMSTVPTVGFSLPVVYPHPLFNVTVYDVGGGPRIRGIWQDYYAEVHGAIFVVDAVDHKRFQASKAALREAVADPRLTGKPILVFANKQDLKGALSEVDLAMELELDQLLDCPHRIVPCVAKASENGGDFDNRIFEGLNWFLDVIDKNFVFLCDRISHQTAEEKKRNAEARQAQRERVEKWQKQQEDGKEGEAEPEGGPESEEQPVVLCCECNEAPATKRCAAAHWEAVCDACAEKLSREDNEGEDGADDVFAPPATPAQTAASESPAEVERVMEIETVTEEVEDVEDVSASDGVAAAVKQPAIEAERSHSEVALPGAVEE